MITIVSLAYNKAVLTREFLERLKKYTDIPHRLIFSDNGSSEDISGVVKEVYPEARLIRYETNIGCPATRNPSMKEVDTNITFWLDNDTMVNSGWYYPFINALADDSVGIVGIDGRRVRKPFNPSSAWIFPDQMYSFDCDWFVGYAVAFKTKYYKPIPDWKLSVNFDDVDLGIGIKTAGKRALMLDSEADLVHLGSQTGPAWKPEETELSLFTRWWDYWEPYSNYLEEYRSETR